VNTTQDRDLPAASTFILSLGDADDAALDFAKNQLRLRLPKSG